VQLHAAAHVLTQLFFENVEKSKNASAITLPVSRTLQRAVVSSTWC
jgi:hypothetical protein